MRYSNIAGAGTVLALCFPAALALAQESDDGDPGGGPSESSGEVRDGTFDDSDTDIGGGDGDFGDPGLPDPGDSGGGSVDDGDEPSSGGGAESSSGSATWIDDGDSGAGDVSPVPDPGVDGDDANVIFQDGR